jgi:hypothetical protein
MRALSLSAVLVSLALAGCARPARADLDADERQLLAQITRDPYIVVLRIQRDADGVAEVVTSQGPQEVRYRLAPAVAGGRELRLRPVDEALVLPTVPGDRPGTGPAPRGAVR